MKKNRNKEKNKSKRVHFNEEQLNEKAKREKLKVLKKYWVKKLVFIYYLHKRSLQLMNIPLLKNLEVVLIQKKY